MARARTHARSWRKKTGRPEWDLGPHSRTIKGPREYNCAPLSKSPQLFTKGWPTHKKYRGEMVAAVTAAATVLCAKQQHNHCAAPDFPSFVQTMWFVQNTFSFILFRLSSSGKSRTRAQGSRHSHGTICIAPIILENLFLHGYIVSLKTPLCWATKGQLDLIKGKAKYKMHLSSRKKEAPHSDCSMAGECGVKTS